MKEPDNDIEEIITQSLAGEISADDQSRLKKWLAEDPEHVERFNELKRVFELGASHYQSAPETALDVNREWEFFMNRVNEKATNVRHLTPAKPVSRQWLRIAAALLILVTIGAAITLLLRPSEIRIEVQNEPKEFTLPDGSQVTLNRHSSLAYAPFANKRQRKVKLTGEAFFEIKRDTANPFVIDINEANVTVLGTSFNIRGYENEEQVEVTVATGLVKFSAAKTTEALALAAGEKGIYIKKKLQLNRQSNIDMNFDAWKTRRIVFVDSNIQAVIKTINEVYGCEITLATEVPPSCAVTVSFNQQSLDAVLNVLKTTLNLSYRIHGNHIEIVKAGC